MARPYKRHQRANQHIAFWLAPAENEALRAFAKRRRLPISHVIRHMLAPVLDPANAENDAMPSMQAPPEQRLLAYDPREQQRIYHLTLRQADGANAPAQTAGVESAASKDSTPPPAIRPLSPRRRGPLFSE